MKAKPALPAELAGMDPVSRKGVEGLTGNELAESLTEYMRAVQNRKCKSVPVPDKLMSPPPPKPLIEVDLTKPEDRTKGAETSEKPTPKAPPAAPKPAFERAPGPEPRPRRAYPPPRGMRRVFL